MNKINKDTYCFSSLQDLIEHSEYNQIDLHDFIDHCVRVKKLGWITFILSPDVENDFAKGIASVIWHNPKTHQINNILNKKLSTKWYAKRLVYNGKRFSYQAGQDYPTEIKKIQRYINSL